MPKRLLSRSAATVLLCIAVLVPAAAAQTDVAGRFSFVWPARGTITGPYGEYRGSHRHAGVDIGMLRSLTVRAAVRGRVRSVGYLPGYSGYGNTVIVSFGHKYRMIYAHLASSSVKKGQIVQRGDQIGVAGCTGSCSGTHLHFELRERGRPVDPAPFLPGLG